MSTTQNILIVDDEAVIGNLLKQLLENSNFVANAFNNPEKAIENFLEDPDYYNLVITDFQMPKINGLDLAKQLREKRPQIPILLMTGYANEDLINKSEECGINEFIEKPFTDLKNIINSVEKSIDLQVDLDRRLNDFFDQFVEILEMVLNGDIPSGLTSIGFIVRALDRNNFPDEQLTVIKEIQDVMNEQIEYIKSKEVYLALETGNDSRINKIGKALSLLKK